MRIPHNLTLQSIQDAFRDVETQLDALSGRNSNLTGRRITNAGKSHHDQDYVIRKELKDAIAVLREEIAALDRRIDALLKSSPYTPTNVTTDRSYDADTVLIAELADVVGTLLADLKGKGILS